MTSKKNIKITECLDGIFGLILLHRLSIVAYFLVCPPDDTKSCIE